MIDMLRRATRPLRGWVDRVRGRAEDHTDSRRLLRHHELSFAVQVEITREEGAYLVHIAPLGVHTFGETEEEALANASDALDSWMAAFSPEELLFELVSRKVQVSTRDVLIRTPRSPRWLTVEDEPEAKDGPRRARGELLTPA